LFSSNAKSDELKMDNIGENHKKDPKSLLEQQKYMMNSGSSSTLSTSDDAKMMKETLEYFEKSFGKSMVDIMMAAKRVEVQLISRTQKESILEACKDIASKYKATKNVLHRGATSDEDLSLDNLSTLLTRYETSLAMLLSTVQNTSITTHSLQEFLPKAQVLRKSILSLKSFLSSPTEKRRIQYKLLQKTKLLEERSTKASSDSMDTVSSESIFRSESDNGKSHESSSSNRNKNGAVENDDNNESNSNVGPSKLKNKSTSVNADLGSKMLVPLDRHKPSFLTLSPRSKKRTEKMNSRGTLSLAKQTTQQPDADSVKRTISSGSAIIQSKNLFEAAERNSVSDAIELRKKGMGINGVDSNGWSALHHSAAKGHMEMCVYLVNEGINVHLEDLQGMKALERACLNGHEKIAVFLANHGSKFDMSSKTGMMIMEKSTLPKSFWETLLKKKEENPSIDALLVTSKSFPISKDSTMESSITHPYSPTMSETYVPPSIKRPVGTTIANKSPSESSESFAPSLKRIEKPVKEPDSLASQVKSSSESNPINKKSDRNDNFAIRSPSQTEFQVPLDLNRDTRLSLRVLFEKFLESLMNCLTIIFRENFTISDLHEPLQQIPISLQNMASLLKDYAPILKPLHESVVALVQCVKESLKITLPQGETMVIEPLIEACYQIFNQFMKAYEYCDPLPNSSEIFQHLQGFLLAIKSFLVDSDYESNVSSNSLVMLLHLIEFVAVVVTKATSVDKLKQREVILACCVLEENSWILLSPQGRDIEEIVKKSMTTVKEVLSLIQTTATSSFQFSGSSFDNVMNTTLSKMDNLLKSKAFKFVSTLSETISSQIYSHLDELDKLSKNHLDLQLLQSCSALCAMTEITNKEMEKLLNGKQLSSSSTEDNVFLQMFKSYHHFACQISLQIKMVVLEEVLKKFMGKQETPTMSDLWISWMQFYLLDTALVNLLSLCNLSDQPSKEKANGMKMMDHFQTPFDSIPLSDLTRSVLSDKTTTASSSSTTREVLSNSESELDISEKLKKKIYANALTEGIEIKALALVKLFQFLNENPLWKDTNISGIATLIQYRKTRELFFRITDLQCAEIVFSFKISLENNFIYHRSSYYFHRFRVENGYNAFSFLIPEEAQVFYDAVVLALSSF